MSEKKLLFTILYGEVILLLHFFMLSVITLLVIMISVIRISVIMLIVFISNVMVPILL
jgi:hypothetical protein